MLLSGLLLLFNEKLTMRSIRYALNARRNSFHLQVDRIRINAHQFTKRRSMNTTMYLTNGRHCLKRNNLNVNVSGLNTITSSTIILLRHSKRRTKGVFRNCRQSIRTITRAGRAYHLITNVGVRRAHRVNELIYRSACQAPIRAARASGSILNGIERRFRRMLIIRRQFCGVLSIVKRIQILEGSNLGHLCPTVSVIKTKDRKDVLRVIKQRRTRRLTSTRRYLLLHVTRRINGTTLTTVHVNATRFLLIRLLINRNLCRIQANSGRITLLLCRRSGINGHQEMTYPANAQARGDKCLQGSAQHGNILVRSKNVTYRTIRAFLSTYTTQVIRNGSKDAILRNGLLRLCGLYNVHLTRQATVHHRIMNVSGCGTTICLSMAKRRTISNGLFLLRTRINTAIIRRLIRLVRQTFIRRRIGAFTNDRTTENILFLCLICTPARQNAFVRFLGLTMCFFSIRVYVCGLIVCGVQARYSSKLFLLCRLRFGRCLINVCQFTLTRRSITSSTINVCLVIALRLRNFRRRNGISNDRSITRLSKSTRCLTQRQHRGLITLLLINSFLRIRVLNLHIRSIRVGKALRRTSIVALTTLTTRGTYIRQISIIRSKTASILYRRGIRFMKLSIGNGLCLVPFLARRNGIYSAISCVCFRCWLSVVGCPLSVVRSLGPRRSLLRTGFPPATSKTNVK